MEPCRDQMVFRCAEQWMGGLFYHIEPWGDGLRLDSTQAATGAPRTARGTQVCIGRHRGTQADTGIPRRTWVQACLGLERPQARDSPSGATGVCHTMPTRRNNAPLLCSGALSMVF